MTQHMKINKNLNLRAMVSQRGDEFDQIGSIQSNLLNL